MYDAKTGAPIYEHVKLINQLEHPALKPGKPVTVYPSSLGGLNYSPSSFDPTTGYVINNQAETASVLDRRRRTRRRSTSTRSAATSTTASPPAPSATRRRTGTTTAASPRSTRRSGRSPGSRSSPEPGRGGVTTTATGLAFAGGGDGILRAFDTYTGNQLWSFQTGFQIAAGPSIYEVDGKEYIAITVGGTPTSSYGGTASQLQIFALKGDTDAVASRRRCGRRAPGPGVLRAPPKYLVGRGRSRTRSTLQLVSSLDTRACKNTLERHLQGRDDGEGAEGLEGLRDVREPRAPAAPTASRSSNAPGGDDAGVRRRRRRRSRSPARASATSSSPRRTRATYVIASTDRRAGALAGEWIQFIVVAGGQAAGADDSDLPARPDLRDRRAGGPRWLGRDG